MVDADDNKAKWKYVNGLVAHISELVASCRRATVSLKDASDHKAKAKAVAAKAKPKAKGAARAKAAAAGARAASPLALFQVFPLGARFASPISTYNGPVTGGPDEHDLSKPFIVDNVAWFHNPEEGSRAKSVLAKNEEFNKVFKKSDLRLVSGKGALPLPTGEAEWVNDRLRELLPAMDDPIDPFGNIQEAKRFFSPR